MNAMDCTDIKANLSALLDDVIDAPARRLAERHLAECRDCRRLMDEAEVLEALVAADAASRKPDPNPMATFEDAVLRRTVYAESTRRVTAWLGWVAAAASLLLTVTLWMVTTQGGAVRPGGGLALGPGGEGATIGLPAPIVLGPPVDSQETVPGLGPAVTLVGRDLPRPGIDAADSETIETAAVLLGRLVNADTTSFQDVEWVRSAIEYENLAGRLEETTGRLRGSDWDTLRSAKWILDRISEGPLSLGDVEQLQRETLQSALVERLSDMAAFSTSATSL
ncbi:MAG: anti-sigma factor family protein [Planctomycetota bacterium]|jgi:hypothetical protein